MSHHIASQHIKSCGVLLASCALNHILYIMERDHYSLLRNQCPCGTRAKTTLRPTIEKLALLEKHLRPNLLLRTPNADLPFGEPTSQMKWKIVLFNRRCIFIYGEFYRGPYTWSSQTSELRHGNQPTLIPRCWSHVMVGYPPWNWESSPRIFRHYVSFGEGSSPLKQGFLRW